MSLENDNYNLANMLTKAGNELESLRAVSQQIEAMNNALIEANKTIRQLYELCPQCEGSVEEWLGQVLSFANDQDMP